MHNYEDVRCFVKPQNTISEIECTTKPESELTQQHRFRGLYNILLPKIVLVQVNFQRLIIDAFDKFGRVFHNAWIVNGNRIFWKNWHIDNALWLLRSQSDDLQSGVWNIQQLQNNSCVRK